MKDESDSLTIDELKAANKELRSQIEQYRYTQAQTQKKMSTILSSIPLGLAIVDEDNVIEATNTQLRQLFGYDSRELVGKPISLLFPDAEKIQDISAPGKLLGRFKNGQTFNAEISVNEIGTEEARRLCVHVKDISESARMLEYKMNLASMVSHDLRTPLTTMYSVLSSINNSLYGQLSEDGIEAVNWAMLSSDYMQTLLENVMDAEKIDATEITIEPVETSTGKVVRKALQLCKLYADALKVELVSDFTNDTFYADETRIVRILVNLISNAIKFSPEGESVRVEAGLDGVNVVFRVIDRGPGVAEDLREKIFDRFQIGSAGSKKAGFGIGLSISRTFAELHGGSISVESCTDSGKRQGSTFTLTIPLRDKNS